MKYKRATLILLLCLSCAAIYSKAYNISISTSPVSPTSYDEVEVTISGVWSDSCIPYEVSTTKDGNIFNIFIPDNYPPGTMCTTVMTDFYLYTSLGRLEEGTYSIEIIFFDDPDTTYIHTFHVNNKKFILNKNSVEVPEEGTSEFEISLFEDPVIEVHINITPTSDNDPDIIITSGSVLVFNDSNPQTVTLSAQKDADNDNGQALFTVSAEGYVTASINVTEIDNDYPSIIYVDQNAKGTNDGSSWANAFTYFQEALNKAGEMPGTEEIKVAGGFYKSKENPEDTTDYISIVSGIKYSGCYAGVRFRENPDLRSIFSFPTVFSSDINGDDGPDFSNRDDNVKSGVIIMPVCDSNTILDGFIISGGETAGGIYINSGSPIVTNCIITGNRDYTGAGIDIRGGSPIIKNCLISGNSSTLNNSAKGGGIYAYGTGTDEVNVNNCTIAYNTASDSGGGILVYSGKININDSITWGNIVTHGDSTTNQLATQFDGTIDALYSCIQAADDLDGINGNIIANPEFAANHLGEYFLSNISTSKKTTIGTHRTLSRAQQVNSPCIDTGSDDAIILNMNDKTTDTNLNNDTNLVDMGFHYPYYINSIMKGDVDLNNEIDIIDALSIAQVYVGINITFFIFENADYNDDSNIDIIDALRIAQYYVGL